MNAPLGARLKNARWGEFKVGDLFEIQNTLSFNVDKLVDGSEYDYVTRTSLNQGILRTTGFVNKENLNSAGTWSLGLLQMDFFYRRRPWYAGQFVRKIIPKIKTTEYAILYFSTLLNMQKKKLLSVLVRNVDETFRNLTISLPITSSGEIDFDFMESFIRELEEERIRELAAYLKVSGLDNFQLSICESEALAHFEELEWKEFSFKEIFNKIEQGRRLKKDDQLPGNIPFVMSGVTNTGVVGYVSNPVASFPANSITVDIFGNSFYRNYSFGAGDDTGVYWSTEKQYSKLAMLFFTSAMRKALFGKFSYGKKLRSSQSLDVKMWLPVKNGVPDYAAMETFISAVQKLVIKDVVLYADKKIAAAKEAVEK